MTYGGTMVPVRGQVNPEEDARFVLSEAQWNEFVELLERPAVELLALRRLLTEPSVLERYHWVVNYWQVTWYRDASGRVELKGVIPG